MDWQPIATAPKDRTPILAEDVDGDYIVVEFVVESDGTSFWEVGTMDGDNLIPGCELFYWTPIAKRSEDS